jgi:hypothetical protein
MDLNIPRPAPIRDGDYETWVDIGYGQPVAVIHLAEGGALDLASLTAGDCDRLIRAAAKVKGQILDILARAAAPHGRRNLYQGTCQLCGKPEDDELHAEAPPCGKRRASDGLPCGLNGAHEGRRHEAWDAGGAVQLWTDDESAGPEAPAPELSAVRRPERSVTP